MPISAPPRWPCRYFLELHHSRRDRSKLFAQKSHPRWWLFAVLFMRGRAMRIFILILHALGERKKTKLSVNAENNFFFFSKKHYDPVLLNFSKNSKKKFPYRQKDFLSIKKKFFFWHWKIFFSEKFFFLKKIFWRRIWRLCPPFSLSNFNFGGPGTKTRKKNFFPYRSGRFPI